MVQGRRGFEYPVGDAASAVSSSQNIRFLKARVEGVIFSKIEEVVSGVKRRFNGHDEGATETL